MKIKRMLGSASIALAMIAATHAQSTITVSTDDLILGFKETGATNNLEVDLGSVTNFLSGGTYATGTETTLSQLSATDLTAQFGTWAGTNQVTFAVAGADGTNNTIWATDKSTTALKQGTSQGTATNAILTVYSGLNNATSTANSATAAAITATGAQSWSKMITTANNFSWSSLNNMATNTTALTGTDGSTSVSLYLYQLTEGSTSAGTLLGTFKLYDNGILSFTSLSAIPEPSTYAMILGVAALGFVMIRRRQQVLA
jgi:hypothetical protein